MTTYATTENYVYHLKAVLYKVGNILFSVYCAIKTTDGITSSLIAGSAQSHGYQNGRGGDARFVYIDGFMQLSPDQILLADTHNHCVRSVDRATNRTSDYEGNCTSSGDIDRTDGLFRFPMSVLIDINNPNHLIIAEFAGALRSLNIVTKSLSTILRWVFFFHNTIQLKVTGNVYIAGENPIGY